MPICIGCHQEVERVNKNGRCIKCAMDRMFEAARQLRDKSGPYYERWKEGMRRAREEK